MSYSCGGCSTAAAGLGRRRPVRGCRYKPKVEGKLSLRRRVEVVEENRQRVVEVDRDFMILDSISLGEAV